MPMNARVVLSGIFFLAAGIAISSGNRYLRQMIRQINGARVNGPFLDFSGFGFHDVFTVFDEHRRLCPKQEVRTRARVAYLIGVSALIGPAISLGMFG